MPTEKEDATTTQVVLTVPDGFSIDSFVAAPGWKREVQPTGSGEDAVIQKVTWTGGKSRPTRRGTRSSSSSAAPTDAKTYTFQVEQTYSDGSVVDWSGPESSDTPAPTVEAEELARRRRSSSTLAIVALVVGAVGVVLGAVALVRGREARSSREARARCIALVAAAAGSSLPAAACAHAYLVRTVPSASGSRSSSPPQRRADLQRGGRAALRDRLGHRRGRARS